ncbi:hypothetical protein TNCV_1146071 [Trichonephila clavipes]|nr:hypothetical protein TNCV_1146071 [Trichonephila clavipes]
MGHNKKYALSLLQCIGGTDVFMFSIKLSDRERDTEMGSDYNIWSNFCSSSCLEIELAIPFIPKYNPKDNLGQAQIDDFPHYHQSE